MSELFDIEKITVGEEKLCAHVAVQPGLPVMTSEDIEATARVYYLAPAIAKHLCLGDAGPEFQDCMSNTEVAHLLEHLSVEIMRETGLAGDIACGRTRLASGEERVFEVELSCPDDVLAIGALSSATFMMDWAFLHGTTPAPDFPGTVEALRSLVLGLRGESDEPVAEGAETGSVADPFEYVEPAGVVDTEGARTAQRSGSRAVFGGAAADPNHAAYGATDDADDPDATAQMPAITDWR